MSGRKSTWLEAGTLPPLNHLSFVPIPKIQNMTIQACNLGAFELQCPMMVRRLDGTPFSESDPDEILRMVVAGIVEAKATNAGRILHLRLLCSEAEGMERMKAIPIAKKAFETSGSITSMASREIFREKLGEVGCWCWTHKQNRNLSGVAA